MIRRAAGPALCLALAFAVASAAAIAGDRDPDADLRRHAAFLLSPEIGDRRAGTPSLEAAAAYVATELDRAGLRGADRERFRTPVPVPMAATGEGTVLLSSRGGEREVVRAGEGLVVLPGSASGEAAGPVVFAGYGLGGREEARDDYAGLDVAGRVVLVVDGVPPGEGGHRSVAAIAGGAAARGAAAVLVAPDPRTATFDEVCFRDGRTESGRVQDRGREFLFVPRTGGSPRRLTLDEVAEIRLAVPPGPPGGGDPFPPPARALPIPVLGVSAAVAEDLVGRRLLPMLDGLDAVGRAGSFEVPGVRVSLRAEVRRERRELPRVAALLPGTDPEGRREPVVVAARLDGEHRAGAALLLEAAARLAAAGPRRRSVLFLFVTAGESGALVPAMRAGLPLAPGRVKGFVVLEAHGRAPALLVPEGEAFTRLRGVAARARLATEIVPGGEEGAIANLVPGYATVDRILAPKPPGPDEDRDLRIAREAVRLVAARVTELADAAPEAAAGADAKPAPAPTAAAAPEAEPTLERARAARLAGDPTRAQKIVEAALDRAPGEAALYLERGRIRLAAGDTAGALEDAANVLKLDTTDGRGWLFRAEVLLGDGKEMEGRISLNEAVQTGLPEALLFRGLRRTADATTRVDLEAGRADLEAAAAAAADRGVGYCARGVLQLLDGRPDRAEALLDRAAELDPLLAETFYWRGRLSTEGARDPALGEKDFDRALRLGFAPGPARFQRGLCLLRLAKYTLAIEDFTECVKRGTSPGASLYNIACAHALVGDREEALDWLGRAVLAGFDQATHARTDPDLASIRDDPRFEGILQSERTD